MSKQNVELWRAAIEDLRSRSFFVPADASEFDTEDLLPRMAELWDPEIEWDASEFADAPDIGGVYRGVDAVQQFWREWLAAWEIVEFEYELVDAGDRIVALIDQRMRGRSTGIEVPFGKYAQVATFRDGFMVHWKLYLSQAEALKDVGLEG